MMKYSKAALIEEMQKGGNLADRARFRQARDIYLILVAILSIPWIIVAVFAALQLVFQ